MRVLLVEDDGMIAQGLQTALRQNNFAVDWVADGKSADAALQDSVFDVVLLDLGLPQRDGLDVLRAMRQRSNATPVIMARMRSVLRRAAGRGDPVIQHGNLRLNPVSHTVERNGAPVNLSAHEFSVLEALLQRPGAVLSRSQLEDRLYGWDEQIGSNAVEVYIHGLRRKLGNDAIRTLRGVGYFVPKP
jgi:two-component system response regulator QseB